MEDFSGPVIIGSADNGEEGFKEISLLHGGPMFNVYLCLYNGKRVILKTVADQSDMQLQALLQKEFEVMSELSHPFICAVYSLSETPVGRAIVMEYVDGKPLDREALCHSPKERFHFAMALLDAFSYLHSKEVVHNDIKPSNILVTPGAYPKIIDFGFSDNASIVRMRNPGCSSAWAAPELLEEGQSDILSDIYSLGKILGMILPQARYRRTLNRAVNVSPAKRWPSVSRFKSELEKDRRRPALAGAVIAILLLSGTFLTLLLGQRYRFDDEIHLQQTVLDSVRRQHFVEDSIKKSDALILEAETERARKAMMDMYEKQKSRLDTCSAEYLLSDEDDLPHECLAREFAAFDSTITDERVRSFCSNFAQKLVPELIKAQYDIADSRR